MQDPRIARVMAVASTGARYFIGSGYLIAPGLLLTAQHVLSPDYEPPRSDTLSFEIQLANNSSAAAAEDIIFLDNDTTPVDFSDHRPAVGLGRPARPLLAVSGTPDPCRPVGKPLFEPGGLGRGEIIKLEPVVG